MPRGWGTSKFEASLVIFGEEDGAISVAIAKSLEIKDDEVEKRKIVSLKTTSLETKTLLVVSS